MSWRGAESKAWSDRFMPEIKGILGRCLISEASFEEDTQRNTDLTVLCLKPWRVGCRVRKYNFIQFSDQFTIRCDRQADYQTELGKIIEGYGDYMFYGFSSLDESRLESWKVLDMNIFRYEYIQI